MLTMKKINKALEGKGLELIRWDGYFTLNIKNIDILPLPDYIKEANISFANGYQFGPLIPVYRLNHLTEENWMMEVDMATENMEEEYSYLKP